MKLVSADRKELAKQLDLIARHVPKRHLDACKRWSGGLSLRATGESLDPPVGVERTRQIIHRCRRVANRVKEFANDLTPKTPIRLLPLPAGTINALLNSGVETVGDGLAVEDEMLRFPNFGKKSFAAWKDLTKHIKRARVIDTDTTT